MARLHILAKRELSFYFPFKATREKKTLLWFTPHAHCYVRNTENITMKNCLYDLTKGRLLLFIVFDWKNPPSLLFRIILMSLPSYYRKINIIPTDMSTNSFTTFLLSKVVNKIVSYHSHWYLIHVACRYIIIYDNIHLIKEFCRINVMYYI